MDDAVADVYGFCVSRTNHVKYFYNAQYSVKYRFTDSSGLVTSLNPKLRRLIVKIATEDKEIWNLNAAPPGVLRPSIKQRISHISRKISALWVGLS